MKKLIVLIISLFMICMITVPVSAAQTAQMSVTVSKDTVSAGDMFTVTVSSSAVKNCVSGGFMFSYDKDVFEYTGGKALVKGFTMAGVTDMAGSLSGYFMNASGSTDIQGELFQVTFKVKDSASSGSYTISGTPSLTTMSGDVKESISCSAGSATVTVSGCSHNWSSEKVTKQPTCKEAGTKILTCTDCNATKTESIDPLTEHTYDHDCDAACNVCGAARTVTHQYKSTWSKDKDTHWLECSVCKNKIDTAAHTPGADATESSPQTCTTCGYIINPVLGHKHDYAAQWTTDEEGHWYTCPGCEEKGSYAEHSFESNGDPECSVCGYVSKPALNDSDITTKPTEVLTIGADTASDNQVTILILSIAIAGCVAALGVLIVILTKKKKRSKQTRK